MSSSYFLKGAAAAAFALSFSVVGAQTVTVDADPAASADNISTFKTLHEAVLSFGTTAINGTDPLPNVINIVPATPVVDKVAADADPAGINPVTISGDITIQGLGGRATLVGLPLSDAEQVLRNSSSAAPLPCFAWRQPVNLTIKDVAFIPSDPNMLSFMVIKSISAAGTTSATLENCLFTANDGSGHPITTTGQDDPVTTAAGVIALKEGGDCIFVLSRQEQGNFEFNVRNSVFASFSRPNPATSNYHVTSDGIISYMNGTAGDFISSRLNVFAGCVFANCGRGIQNPYGGNVNVQGTDAKPVVFRNLTGLAGIYNLSDTTVQPTACTVNHAHFYNLAKNAIGEYETRGFVNSVTNSVIANCRSDGMNLASNGALPPNGEATDTITIDNVVFHFTGVGSAPAGIYTTSAFDRNINITNSIFTSENAFNFGVAFNGIGTCTVSNSVMSLQGTNALRGQTAGSGNIVLDGSVTDGLVTYLNMTDPFSPDFFKVAGSTVRDWSVY